MIRLSSRQYATLRDLPRKLDVADALRYNQITLGSLAQRGFIQKSGDAICWTSQGLEAYNAFGRDDVYRKIINDHLSNLFDPHFHRRRKRRAA